MSYYGRGDGGEYRHNGYDQQANNRERSRSRDHNDRLFGGGGGGRGGDHYGGGGYGGRNGGRNGGGGGGRGWNGDRGGRGGGGGHRAPRPTNLEVSLNYFPIKVIDSDLMEWVMYDIHVLNMKRVKKKDAEGNFIEPWEFDFVPNQKGATNMDKFPEVLLRRILDALRKQNNFILVTDGKAICYTNKRLFSKEESTSANPGSHEEASGLSAVGRYGPADTGGHNMPIGPSDIYNDYYVRTKRNVDENDPDADKSKNAWYRVRLKEVAAIPFSEVKKALTGMQQESEYLHKVKQATEIIMKSGMFAVMNSFGKSPRKFYFPEDVQDQIMGEFRNQSSTRGIQDLLRDFSSRNPLVPYIGIESRLKPCTGNMFVNTDTCLDYFYREHYRTRGPHQNDNKEPVPVLHEENRSIAGVRIPNVHGRIPEHLQPEVKQAIKKLRFHVTYYRKKNSEAWLQRKREQGWDDKKIKRANRNVRKNCTMKLDDDKKGIIWSADDPNEHSFEMNVTRPTEDNPNPDKVTQTIESYYREKYGILLKYPKMPCVYIGKREWYPIEFLFQAQEKASHPNLNEMKLKYYDEIAGFHRSVHIRKSYQKLAGLLQNDPNHDLLRQFGIMRIDEPITLRAKVLPEPKLSFANQEAHINDGKWNLMNKKFKRPADLPSFAFINMTHDKSNKYMSGLFESMEKHGIILPQNVDCRHALGHVTCNMKVTRSPDPEHVYDAFIEAIGRAKSFFLYDKQGAFRKNNVWFKTRFLKDGNWEECLVIPPPEHIDTDTVGIMLRGGPTHMLGDTPVRIMAGCVDMGGNQKVVDPFNLRFKPHSANNGPPHQMFENNKWEQCRFVKYFYQTQDGKIIDDDPDNAMPYTFVEPGHNIEMVAMVFVFLPSDDSQTYNTVKLMSQFEFGIPSQCCVIEKFNKQKGKGEQFLSNIALKLNAKLMNSDNKAFAWVTSPNNAVPGQRSHGIPWINEIPTLVIGISLSHGLGEESITVVGASVGLDPCLMQFAQLCRVQKKSEKGQHDTVSEGTMMYLTQTLFLHFLLHNGVYPQRVLIYRNGASDGEFDTIRDREVIAMRKGLRKIIQQQKGDEFNCPLSCQSGCLHCTPPITYVVCQTQHSIVVVPKDQNLAPRANQNVPSGTCVDEKTIMDYRDGQLMATRDIDRNKPSNSSMELFENVEEYGYDFILTSHGGLKGTSKPVYYRVVLNENAVWRPMSDCSPLTKNMLQVCTYHQSFQYGTATKTVRAVPVVHYSQRIANQFMGYVNQIRPNKRQDLRRWDTDGCPLIEIKTENMDESDPSLDQEEKSSGRVYYIHKKMNGPDKKALPECMREEIQFASSPFEPEDDFETNGLRLRPPLRPHISA